MGEDGADWLRLGGEGLLAVVLPLLLALVAPLPSLSD